MADRFPLILNTSTNQIQEIPSGDNLDLTGVGINNVGVITSGNVQIGGATTDLVVTGDARITGILTVGTSSLKLDGPNNLVNVGTALTLGHTQGVQFHTQNLHSAGFEVNQINASGIITATGADINGDLDVDGHTNLDNVSVAGVTTFTGNANFGSNGYISGSANFTLTSNKLRVTGSDTVGIECQRAGNATIQCTDTSNSTDLQLRANSSGGLVRTATNKALILGTYQKSRIQITNEGKVQIGLPGSSTSLPGAVEVVNIRAMTDGNLCIRAIGSISGAPSGSGVGIDVLNDANNAVKDLALRGSTIIFKGASAETVRIDSSGRLLVGSAAVTYNQSPLYVSGTDPVVATFHHSDGGTNDEARIALGALVNNPPYNRGVYLTAENNGNGHDFIVATSASHAAGPSEKLRIPSAGGIELKTDGKGIQFPTPQTPYHASSNRVGISSEMRYYETGTITPGLSSTVLNGLQIATFTDASYARRVNRYVRVGHIVHCFIEIKMASSVTYNGGNTSTAPVCITGTCPFKWAYSGRYDVSGEPDFIPCSISYDSSGLTNDSVYAVLTRNYNAQPRIDITRVGTGGSRQFNSVNFGMVFPANASIAVAYSYPIDLDNADY